MYFGRNLCPEICNSTAFACEKNQAICQEPIKIWFPFVTATMNLHLPGKKPKPFSFVMWPNFEIIFCSFSGFL
jgi:hypothetical protein